MGLYEAGQKALNRDVAWSSIGALGEPFFLEKRKPQGKEKTWWQRLRKSFIRVFKSPRSHSFYQICVQNDLKSLIAVYLSMALQWSGFVCESIDIMKFLQKLESSRVYYCSRFDDPRRGCSAFYADGMRDATGYRVAVMKERFGYRGSVQASGPDEAVCAGLLHDFFAETEAVKLSENCPQLWKPAMR